MFLYVLQQLPVAASGFKSITYYGQGRFPLQTSWRVFKGNFQDANRHREGLLYQAFITTIGINCIYLSILLTCPQLSINFNKNVFAFSTKNRPEKGDFTVKLITHKWIVLWDMVSSDNSATRHIRGCMYTGKVQIITWVQTQVLFKIGPALDHSISVHLYQLPSVDKKHKLAHTKIIYNYLTINWQAYLFFSHSCSQMNILHCNQDASAEQHPVTLTAVTHVKPWRPQGQSYESWACSSNNAWQEYSASPIMIRSPTKKSWKEHKPTV